MIDPTTVYIEYRRNKFFCLSCGAYTSHNWWLSDNFYNVAGSRCTLSNGATIWHQERLLWPSGTNMPLPSADMPEPAKGVYEEARSIAGLSPRGAAALLRLATEHLVNHLGAKGRTIDDKIQDLVDNYGLDPLVQQMLDSLRVIGNEQIHPGTIKLDDDPEMLPTLFSLMNEIVAERITKPNRVKALYESLPQPKLEGIAQRDHRAKSKATSTESSSANSGPPKPPPPTMQ